MMQNEGNVSPQNPTPEPTTDGGVTRRALKVGVLAALFGLIGRTTARAQDALTIAPDGATIYAKYINFRRRLGALITLYDPDYGLGIQPHTFYTRSGKNFAWYKGGSYVEKELDPGGGATMMSLSDGTLTVSDKFVSKSLTAAGATITGDMTATGAVTAGSLTSGWVTIKGNNALEFGAGIPKEGSAGQIAYQRHSKDSLDFVGAGTEWNKRKISMWAEGGATLYGPLTVDGGVNMVPPGQKAIAVAGGVEALRIVRGVVNGNGTPFPGTVFSGFSVTPKAGGQDNLYDIAFTDPYPAVPAAFATQIFGNLTGDPGGGSTTSGDTANIVQLRRDGMRVATFAAGGRSGGDRAFSFAVIGPQLG